MIPLKLKTSLYLIILEASIINKKKIIMKNQLLYVYMSLCAWGWVGR